MSIHRAWVWCLIFVLAAMLSPMAFWLHWESMVAAELRPIAENAPVLQLVWIFGGLPLTAFFLILAVLVRKHARRRATAILIGFVLGSALELLAKHVLAFRLPVAVAEPTWLSHIEAYLNIGPSQLGAWIHQLHPSTSGKVASSFLRGSYPSGHTFRLTYVAGIWISPRHRPWVGVVAALTAFMVTATGGHWFGDAIGGYALAMMVLVATLPFKPRSGDFSGPRHPSRPRAPRRLPPYPRLGD